MNDIHNNENISQEEEFVSPGQEKVNGKATPEQSGPSTGEPREQPGEPTEEAVEIEETEEIEIIEDGEFTVPKKEEEEEENGKRGGIAVKNVNNRIKLLFGEEYGIYIYSQLDVGTDVEITLPIVRD